MKRELKEVKNESFAYELLKEQQKQNKRLFIVIIVILAMWFATIGYLVYTLNDIGTMETTETYDMSTDSGNNNFVGGDNNGDIENN